MDDILTDARRYLMGSLQGKGSRTESRHPWRKTWKFLVLHSLRVETYAVKILEIEEHDLSRIDITSIRLAAIFHDIGRLDTVEDHASLGAQIAGQWLSKHWQKKLSKDVIEIILGLVAGHSDKDIPEKDFRAAVLKDADTLDEIGALSIFMAANWVDHQSPLFFQSVRQRLIDFEIPFCDQKLSILNTMGARRILHEKKYFIEKFIAQLTDELEMAIDPGQLLAESRWTMA